MAEVESPLYEEFPVTDLDIFLPTGDVKDFTLKDGVDTYDLTDDAIIITYANGEALVMFYRAMAGYSIRKRMQKRKIDTKAALVANPAPASPPAEPLQDETDPSYRPGSRSSVQ
jgi:hypothetical protein